MRRSTGDRLFLCLFALASAASTMSGVWANMSSTRVAGALVSVGFMALLGAGFYLLLPASRIRHRALVHLGRVSPGRVSRRHRRRGLDYRPDVVEEVARLAGAAGVRLHSVWMNLDDPRGTALVFGRAGRRYLELRRGMVRRFDTDRAAFRCIVNHELGHLRYRDVDAIHLPAGLFLGFVCLISTSFDFFPGMPHRATQAGAAVQYFGFVVVAYLTRNSILREREYHADAFAIERYDGGADEAAATLDRLLQQGTTTPLSLWERLIGVHPPATARIAALWDRREQPSLPPVDGLMLGVLVSATAAIGWPVLVLIPVAAVVVASAVWRFVRTNLVVWGPRRGLTQFAAFTVALLLGLLAGAVTAPTGAGNATSYVLVSAVGIVGWLVVSVAWQRPSPGKATRVRPQPEAPATAPMHEPPVSAATLLGRGLVAVLAIAVVGLMVLAATIAVRRRLTADEVVDPFTALIVAALTFHLLSLGRAIVADNPAAARQHRTLAGEALGAIGLLCLAGGVYFGLLPLRALLPSALVIGLAMLLAAVVTSKAADYLYQAATVHRHSWAAHDRTAAGPAVAPTGREGLDPAT